MNTLSTADGDLQSLNPRGKVSIRLPDPTKLRQQHNYEVLVDPEYRIDIALADKERYDELKATLEAGKSHYVPSLGLSEHLAEVEYHGEFDITATEQQQPIAVDSAIPNVVDDVVIEPDTRCQFEKSPAFMTTDPGGRTTTAFTTYTYNPDGEPLRSKGVTTNEVGGRTVVFV
jgi:CRISPR-associated protein Cas5h